MIQAIGNGYLVQTPTQNVPLVFPIGDGTNNYSATVTCLNLPTQPIKIKIIKTKSVSGQAMLDFWDISGQSGLNATLKLRIPKSALTKGNWTNTNQFRYFNGERYVPISNDRVTVTTYTSYIEVTITGLNSF